MVGLLRTAKLQHSCAINGTPIILVMKRIISSLLIGVILYFLLPFISKFIPHYRLAVWSITAAIVSFAVSTAMDKA